MGGFIDPSIGLYPSAADQPITDFGPSIDPYASSPSDVAAVGSTLGAADTPITTDPSVDPYASTVNPLDPNTTVIDTAPIDIYGTGQGGSGPAPTYGPPAPSSIAASPGPGPGARTGSIWDTLLGLAPVAVAVTQATTNRGSATNTSAQQRLQAGQSSGTGVRPSFLSSLFNPGVAGGSSTSGSNMVWIFAALFVAVVIWLEVEH